MRLCDDFWAGNLFVCKFNCHPWNFFFLLFQNGGFFPIAYFFSDKTAFLRILANFVTRFEKLFNRLKALQTRMQIDKNYFFVAQMVPEIYAKKHKIKKHQDVFFCYSLYILLDLNIWMSKLLNRTAFSEAHLW